MSQSSQMGRHRQHGPQQQQALEATCSSAAAAAAAVTSCLQEVIACTTSSQQLASVLSQPVLTATPPAVSAPELQLGLATTQASPRQTLQSVGKQSDANQLSSSSPSSSPSHQKQQRQQQQQGSGTFASINPSLDLAKDTRTHVVAELFDTERSYVESLQILIEKYMKPLKSQALIDSNLVDEIFYTIPELMQHHTIFLSALQERLTSDWDSSQVIGNVFIEAFTNQQIIDTYTKFINNWKNARHAIKVANQTKPAFKGFLESTSREHKNKLTLDALLIMPVQRIPRYELLIKELIKHTPADHPDHMPLVEAQKKIHELALKIDRAEKEMVHQEQLRELEALIENHSGLIQQPQRDFIRYDLVTIASSTLTVTKKERVLFLFCDLLIITSVKKKVSRRSNLQAAFANSDHDITLLEGNKFKLILRASLDQVDIRCDNNEQTLLWQQQQQQHELELLNLAKERQVLEEYRRKLESDLLVLHQMELLVGQLISANRGQLAANIAQMTSETLGHLKSLEAQRADCESNFIQPQPLQHRPLQNSPPPCAQDSHQSQVAAGGDSDVATSTNHTSDPDQQQQQQQLHSKQLDPTLEFIISQEVSLRDLLKMNSNASSREESQLETMPTAPGTSNSALGGASSSAGSLAQNKSESKLVSNQNLSYESLVVSFPSFDRRQAFIEAFLEAKRERLKQQQRRLFLSQHPDQQLLKSRSLASDLRRRAKLQHQDEISHQERSLNNLSLVAAAGQQQQQPVEGILSTSCSSFNQIGRCGSCSSHQNLCSRPDAATSSTHSASGSNNHHHHHQLMHQPASHPALLHTICCHEQHNDNTTTTNNNDNCDTTASGRASLRSLEQDEPRGSCAGGQEVAGRLLGANQTTSMCLSHSTEPDEPQRQSALAGLKFVPRFLAMAPAAAFLNSQHPALQLTCSLQPRGPNSTRGDTRSHQTIRDRSGQLWLCMSNGYVSHIALIEFVVSDCDDVGGDQANSDEPANRCLSVVPVFKSGGDVCKSKINCAAQVNWANCQGRKLSDSAYLQITQFRDDKPDQTREVFEKDNCPSERPTPQPPPPEVSVKSASPPMDLVAESRCSRAQVDDGEKLVSDWQMSHSAPAVGLTGAEANRADRLSSSSSAEVKDGGNSSGARRQLPRRSAWHRNPPTQQHHHHNGAHQSHHRCASSTACNQSGARHSRQPANQQHHNHLHQHYHYDGAHQHHHHQLQYSNRHHTVSLAELRRAHQRQLKSTRCDNLRDQFFHLEPAANASTNSNTIRQQLDDQTTATNRSGSLERVRSSTPPLRNVLAGTRTKQLRHQASLKTSAILAKLVSGAGRASSSYLRRSAAGQGRGKSEEAARNLSDAEDQNSLAQADLSEAGSNQAGSVQSMATPQQQQHLNSIVSPLSSISSLNSSNSSSMAPIWTGTPMYSSCTGLSEGPALHCSGPQSNCCAELLLAQQRQSSSSSREDLEQVAAVETCLRSRSATVPSRTFCEQLQSSAVLNQFVINPLASALTTSQEDAYRVNEILETSCSADQTDRVAGRGDAAAGVPGVEQQQQQQNSPRSSLWLGCDDGSLLVIDCLTSGAGGQQKTTDSSSCCQQEFCCHNIHSELNLGSPISDIVNYEDKRVFVALADGRLVVFERQRAGSLGNGHQASANTRAPSDTWQLEGPQIVSVVPVAAANETSSKTMSKLCLISEQHELWFSHNGRIFILDLDGFGLKGILTPPGGDQLNCAQIDAMESVGQFGGVWVLFKEPHCLIRFYEASGQHKLLLETSLMQPISKVLSCGNEIIRQHKSACLGTSATLSLFDEREQSNSLLIGTSAGIILILTLGREQLREQVDSNVSNWSPQVISLRHGHSGHVKFLQLIKPERTTSASSGAGQSAGGNELILVSGGAGFDLYGPNDGSQLTALQHDDCLNHLIFWAI